jgi:hypothetical protein
MILVLFSSTLICYYLATDRAAQSYRQSYNSTDGQHLQQHEMVSHFLFDKNHHDTCI